MIFSPALTYRFKKDHNLPIPIHFKENFFNYYLDIMSRHLYPNVKMEWDNMKRMIGVYGDADSMLDRYAWVKDAVIEYIKSSEKYKEFNQCKLPSVKNDIPTVNLYNDANIGKKFVSVDLRHANFQTLRKYGVIPKMGWQEFIENVASDIGCTDSDKMLIDYVANSKYTRQVIFGQCNPKRTIALEKVYINEVREVVDQMLPEHILVSINSDELIYEIPQGETFDVERAQRIQERVMDTLALEIRIDYISFVGVKLVTEKGYTVATGYLNKGTGKNFFKCVPEPYMPMVIEWFNAGQGTNELLNGFDNFSLYSQYIVHDGVICRIDEKIHIEII